MRSQLALLALCGVAASFDLLVGSAGCDVTDTVCVPPPAVDLVTTVRAEGGQLTRGADLSAGKGPGWVVKSAGRAYVALGGESALAAYTVHEGALSPLGGKMPTGGVGPAFFSLSHDRAHAFVANYGGCDNCTKPDGSVSVMRVAPSGAMGAVTQNVPHHGHSVNPDRQLCAHVHSVYPHPDPAVPVVYACDLGLDTITTYKFDAGKEALSQVAVASASRPGAGPRHMAFHPLGHVAYVLEEMGNAVAVYDIDAADGRLTFRKAVATTAVTGGKAAEVVVLGGQGGAPILLYASNRGDCDACNSVQAFEVHPATGDLAPRAATATRRFPRGIEPYYDAAAGVQLLFVASQGEGYLTQYRVGRDGALAKEAELGGLNTPATIAFL